MLLKGSIPSSLFSPNPHCSSFKDIGKSPASYGTFHTMTSQGHSKGEFRSYTSDRLWVAKI